MQELSIQPRIIRAGQAPGYCGMNERLFISEIRLFVTEVPIGERGIGFDRLELDQAIEEYIARCGRVPFSEEHSLCEKAKQSRQDSQKLTASSKSTRLSTVTGFTEAAKQVTKHKRNNT